MQLNKLSPDVVSELENRLKDEYTAFYTYRAISNWCKNVGYEIAAAFFANESQDELSHAKIIENYLVDWNLIPNLPIVKPTKNSFNGLDECLTIAYKLEFDLYKKYDESSIKIFDSGNAGVFDMLKSLRDIQTKSVAEYSTMLNKIEGVELNKTNFLLLEKTIFGE